MVNICLAANEIHTWNEIVQDNRRNAYDLGTKNLLSSAYLDLEDIKSRSNCPKWGLGGLYMKDGIFLFKRTCLQNPCEPS